MVNVSCCWTGGHSRFGVKWLKNQASVKNETILHQAEEFPKLQIKRCSFLVFKSITCRDSGTYICKISVEIPVLTETEGDGTVVMVTHIDHPDHPVYSTADDKENTARTPTMNTADNTNHHSSNEDKEKTIGTSKVTTVDSSSNLISKDGENTAKNPKKTKADNTNHHSNNDVPQDDMLIFVLRCLPIVALITAFFWLYYSGIKAQQDTSAPLRDKPTSAESIEDNQGEDEGRERETEAAKD
ncbi:uncharacterized protein LOC112450719 isoform X2 [Kryptolebias marmoratus]|nr:uncharacterized protein LOC112450719 isoform X2 [Kryptolebias marmoratus]XP_037832307.1 uncharacterized protein LOC112450719 isoform X2 [Kryptolebias marmoratus]